MLLKLETQQTFVNGLLGFITLGIYTPLEARCVLLPIIAWVAYRYGQLYLHCSLIYFWVPSSCFCIVISLSLRVARPVQRCLPVRGRLHYPRRRRWWLHALWPSRLLWVQPTTTSGNILTQSIIFNFSIRLTPSCILHRARQHHADASACR